jgi:hypothetical protein
MLELPRAPHADPGGEDFPDVQSFAAFRKRIRVALKDDQRGRAGRMCRGEKRRWAERAVDRKEDRLAAPEIVEHRSDAVGPLLQGRQRARRDRIGRTGARLIEKMRRPSDVIASTQP